VLRQPALERDDRRRRAHPGFAVPQPGPGVYRLTFEIEGHVAGETFYPQVVVVFRATDPAGHYHVPVLLSPFSYTTYRGS
jgi:5-hydroxyisourate hydrolase